MTPQEYEKSKAQIEHIAKMCAADNWCGSHSRAVTPEIITLAKAVLDHIRTTADPPRIHAQPRGIIDMAWESADRNGDQRSVSITIYENGEMEFGYSVTKSFELDEVPSDLWCALVSVAPDAYWRAQLREIRSHESMAALNRAWEQA